MFDIIRGYKAYLERECRLPQDAVIHYLGNLPIILDHLNINTLQDINLQKVTDAWRLKRWEITDDGIQVSEKAQNGYLRTFKEFLAYLEKSGRLQRQGLAEIIRIPEARTRRIRGLNNKEIRQLKAFLRFHVDNHSQRRETALTWFLLQTGCSISAAMALNVHSSGRILTEPHWDRSGNFWVENGRVHVTYTREEGEETTRVLEDELVHYLNFYLENRKYTSPILFLSDARRNHPSRLKAQTAERIIERLFLKAGIPVKKGCVAEILRATAMEQGILNDGGKRQILSLHDSERYETETLSAAYAPAFSTRQPRHVA